MKTLSIEERIDLYDSHLKSIGICDVNFSITDKFCENFYFKFVFPNTKLMHLKMGENQRNKIFSNKINYVKLNLLKVKYKRNNYKSKNIKEGFVYIIRNKAFKDWIKVGSTIDVYDRLNTYQTYSPFRDYELIDYYFSYNRLAEESMYHKKYKASNEWIVECDEIFEDFKTRKIRSRDIKITVQFD